MNPDHRFRLASQIIDGLIALVRTGLIAAAVVALGYYFQNALVALAGKQTEASLSFSLVTKLHADRWFAYLFGASGLGYGYVQRNLRRRNIKRLTEHTEEMEKIVHPERTSSGLTPEGRTQREDR